MGVIGLRLGQMPIFTPGLLPPESRWRCRIGRAEMPLAGDQHADSRCLAVKPRKLVSPSRMAPLPREEVSCYTPSRLHPFRMLLPNPREDR